MSPSAVVVLAGGVGAARFLQGVVSALPDRALTIIGNVGDDLDVGGLHACRHIHGQDDCFFKAWERNDGGGPGGCDHQRCDAGKQDDGRNMASVVRLPQCLPDHR